MARTRKAIQSLNLYKYDVLIEDRGTRSDYFKISQFDGYFYGGRNAFLIAGSQTLQANSKLLVEVLNVNGEIIYSAPVSNFIEGGSRLVQVEVYSDTPPGPGKLVVLGTTDTYLDGTPVPEEWRGKYNIRWITDVIISPQVNNKTPIRFINTPSMIAEEKFYAIPATASFTQSSVVEFGDYELTPTNYNAYQNGYLIRLKNPTTESVFKSDYLNGKLSTYVTIQGTSEFIFGSVPITRIFNETTAESRGSFLSSSLKTKILSGFISGAGFSYPSTIQPFGDVTVNSSINAIRYNKLVESDDIGSLVSFAKLRISNLNTISGEINKVRVFYKSITDAGDYVLLADVPTRVDELLTVDSGSKIVSVGQFNKPNISNYWYAATMSVAQNSPTDILPSYYVSSSVYSNLSIVQSSKRLLNAITTTPEISSSNSTYTNNISYFIGNTSDANFELFPNSEYTLQFDAIVSNESSSIELDQSTYDMEVYLIVPEDASTSSKLLDVNPRGQLLGTLSYNRRNGDQLFEQIQLNFKPKIITPTTVGLRFVIYGGFWDIANISLKPAEEQFFSPDEINLLLPIQNSEQNILSFKTEFLDVNSNSAAVYAFSTPVYFTGSSDYVKKIGDYMTGELYIKGLPIQQQALQDGFTGLVSGGLITVNTPASWSYTISSGSGYVIDNYTNPLNPTYTYVTWPEITKMPNAFATTGSVASYPRTNIAISASGQLIEQPQEWTTTDYRKYIVLGRIAHVGTTFIQRALSLPLTTYNRGFHWFDLANAIGIINVEGNIYYASGSSMSIGKTSGKTYRVGSNYRNDTTFPDITTDPPSLPTTFAYRYRSGSGFKEDPLTTIITGSLYDKDTTGILEPVLPNKFTVQRIYYFGATNTTRIQFGQKVYDTMVAAQDAAVSEQFTVDPNLERDSSLRAYLIVGSSATDLSDTNDAEFIPQGKFGSAGGSGGGGGGSSTLAGLTDVSLTGLTSGQYLRYNGSTWVNNGLSGSLFGTSSWASNSISSSFATTASFTTTASFAVSSSRAVTSSFAISSSFAPTILPAGTVSASSQIDHNTTTNYVANQHIDHTSVSIVAGTGLTGGGTIAASRTLNVLYVPSTDNRAVNNPPSTASAGLYADFKTNTTDNLVDGGTYHGVLTFRPYGSTTDFSGGPAYQMGFTENGNLYLRSGSNVTWSPWNKLLFASGTLLGTASFASSASFATSASWAPSAGLPGGTANYIPLWTSATAQSSSNIYQSSGNIGIGTTIPSKRLEVVGSDALINGLTIGRGAGNFTSNVAIGTEALLLNSAGTSNTAVGTQTLYLNTVGFNNTAIGNSAMLFNRSGSENTAVGNGALSALQNSGSNTAVGRSAMASTQGIGNTAIGRQVFAAHTVGDYNIVIGETAGSSIVTGSNNLIIGRVAGETSLSDTIILAAGTVERIRVDSSGNMGVGTSTPGTRLHVQGAVSASSYTSSLNNQVGYFGTASFAVSASWAPGGSSSPAFPYTGSAQITGSVGITGSLNISGSTYIRTVVEQVASTGSAPSSSFNFDVLNNAIFFFSGSTTRNWTLNFRGNASTTLNSMMPVTSSMTVTLLTRNGATPYSASAYQIDGTSITPRWQGGITGSGNPNSIDAHTFTIVKISSTPSYLLLGSITRYS